MTGAVEAFRDDERYCPLTRYGVRHASHIHGYFCTRPNGEVVRGAYDCDGLMEDQEPFPLRAQGGEARSALRLLEQWLSWWRDSPEAPAKMPGALHVRTAIHLIEHAETPEGRKRLKRAFGGSESIAWARGSSDRCR